MSTLVRHHLFEKRLPLDRLEIVRDLYRFFADAGELKNHRDGLSAEDLETLRLRHDRVMQAVLERVPPNDTFSHRDAVMAFACGALRLTHYRDTVYGRVPVLDTCGSKTLRAFEIDVESTDEARRAITQALRKAFSLDEADLAELSTRLEPELAAKALRHAIVEAIDKLVPLSEGTGSEAAVHRLFTHFYPGHPLRVGEISIIRTGTALFFCVDYQDQILLTPGWHDRSEDERREVSDYLARLTRFQQRFFAHFPVFGSFRAEHADREFVQQIATQAGYPITQIDDALNTMMTVIASPKVDKFIVHDAWGHQWQSLLFRFDETYRAVSTYDQLPLLDQSTSLDGVPTTFMDAVIASLEGEVDTWDRWLATTLSRRLIDSLSGLYAEVLADAVEHKYLVLRPQDADDLLSSSFFKELPTKLDLTLWDIPLYMTSAVRGFERFAERPDKREALLEAVLARRPELDRRKVAATVEHLADRTASWLDKTWRRQFDFDADEEGVHINMFGLIALNFLSFQARFNHVYDELAQKYPRRADGPLRGFQDLMVFASASFYEQDWYRRFWQLDGWIQAFASLFAAFTEALDEA